MSALHDLKAALEGGQPEAELLPYVPPEVRPRVRLTSIEPIKVLAQCKAAALKADVSLAWWVEFSATARACLTPDCEPAEIGKFLDVVRERFEVT